ncbi:MAG: HNH endonuclease [Pseudomonadota bacterium]
MKGIFSHKQDSGYDDLKGERYHFPKQYLARVKETVGDFVIYYEKGARKGDNHYTGCARVIEITNDTEINGRYYAHLADYIDFDRVVYYREDGGFERKLVLPDGRINGGVAINAVRLIEEREFAHIIDAGLSQEPNWPDRDDDEIEPAPEARDELFDHGRNQPELIGAPAARRVMQQLVSRKWRDTKFKQNVRVAYDRTCAFTGLRLINGKGRPEVEAAHIRPVSEGGNDWIRNGIALSGTVHWMFDRGLLSMGDDFEILQSRKLNHDVSNLLRHENIAKVPDREECRPHPEYLKWHRTRHNF